MRCLAVLGGGSWGTALSVVQAPNFDEVYTVMHNLDLAREIQSQRENRRYLPGVRLPDNILISANARQSVPQADVILVAVPSAYVRSTVAGVQGLIAKDALLVSAAKGLEPGTLLCMSQVIAQAAAIDADRILALSGPSFAIETAQGLPTAVVLAGCIEPGRRLQSAFAGPTFRVYSSEDRVGVEIGGALKNVVAIGAGMAFGLGLGHNAVAALITRGLAEITRLAAALGAQPRTLSGLAGLGDLVLTCTGELSRNRQLGIQLSQAGPHSALSSVSHVLSKSSSTTEGVRTAAVAVELGRRLNVTMPIAEEMQAVLHGGRSPADAIRRLMDRSLKEE